MAIQKMVICEHTNLKKRNQPKADVDANIQNRTQYTQEGEQQLNTLTRKENVREGAMELYMR